MSYRPRGARDELALDQQLLDLLQGRHAWGSMPLTHQRDFFQVIDQQPVGNRPALDATGVRDRLAEPPLD